MERAAPTEATVLLLGETGTGKELVAETIHGLSRRHKEAFLPINCGAVSPNLIESELFGHERGSFTGAMQQHQGHFERAFGGTLLLDEITDMPPSLQTKLLRVLESKTFLRVGGERPIASDVRIIAATNRPVAAVLRDGQLREDLYYRLSVFPVTGAAAPGAGRRRPPARALLPPAHERAATNAERLTEAAIHRLRGPHLARQRARAAERRRAGVHPRRRRRRDHARCRWRQNEPSRIELDKPFAIGASVVTWASAHPGDARPFGGDSDARRRCSACP